LALDSGNRRQIGRDDVHLLLRLFDGHARLQPAVDDQRAEVTIGDLARCKRDWNPEIGRRTIPVSRCKDADDGVWDRIHPNLTSDDAGISAEALAPEPVAQEHDVLLAWLTLIGLEITPKPDPFAEDAKPTGRDLSRGDPFRRIGRCEIERTAGPPAPCSVHGRRI
jgi:hypothetical protein